MAAEVGGSGTIVHGSRVTGVTRIGTGSYQVDFDRNVTHCTYAATSFFFNVSMETEPRSGDANGVFLGASVSNTANPVDTQFYLTVTC